MSLTRGRRVKRVAMIATAVAIVTAGTAVAASSVGSLKSGQTVFFIPKDTLNPYEVIADRGGKLALTKIGNKQVVQSGTKDTAAAQLPAVQTAIQTGANAIVIAGNDPAALCPQLKQAMAKGIAVVSFDSDVNCRQLFINQAVTETIGRSQIQELGKEMGYKGEFAILSAASTASNQNAWIKYMKLELKLPKYKNMKLVKIYYGNDDPAQSLQATESMLQAYPNLKGIESPTTVGISSAAQYLSNSKYKGKVVLQGLGLPRLRALEPGEPRLPRGLRGREHRLGRHQGQGRRDLQGRQARLVQDHQGRGRPRSGPRASVPVHQEERGQVQLLRSSRVGRLRAAHPAPQSPWPSESAFSCRCTPTASRSTASGTPRSGPRCAKRSRQPDGGTIRSSSPRPAW